MLVDGPSTEWVRRNGGDTTFCTWEFHLRPPTRTLTVFCIRPADTTTPWSSRVTRLAAAVKGLSMVVRVESSSDG